MSEWGYAQDDPAEQLAKLRAIQKEIGVPVSESIRRAIDLYLQQKAKKK